MTDFYGKCLCKLDHIRTTQLCSMCCMFSHWWLTVDVFCWFGIYHWSILETKNYVIQHDISFPARVRFGRVVEISPNSPSHSSTIIRYTQKLISSQLSLTHVARNKNNQQKNKIYKHASYPNWRISPYADTEPAVVTQCRQQPVCHTWLATVYEMCVTKLFHFLALWGLTLGPKFTKIGNRRWPATHPGLPFCRMSSLCVNPHWYIGYSKQFIPSMPIGMWW